MDHQDVEPTDSSFRRSSRRSAQMMSFIKLNMIHENSVLNEEEWQWLLDQEKKNLALAEAEAKTERNNSEESATNKEKTQMEVNDKCDVAVSNKVMDGKCMEDKEVQTVEEKAVVFDVQDGKQIEENPASSVSIGGVMATKFVEEHVPLKSSQSEVNINNIKDNVSEENTRRGSVVRKGILKNNGLSSKYSLNGNDNEFDSQTRESEADKKKKGFRGFFKNMFSKNSKTKKKKRDVVYL